MVVETKRELYNVEVRPDTIELPEELETTTGVASTKTQFTAQVQGDQGQNPIQAIPETPVVQIPADQATLTSLSKGPITNAITWLAAFWLRIVKMAARFGWRIVVGRLREEK